MNHSNLYNREFKGLLNKAGLQDQGFTFHSLRHTFATSYSGGASTRRKCSHCSDTPPSRRRWTATHTSWRE
jgi:integrase